MDLTFAGCGEEKVRGTSPRAPELNARPGRKSERVWNGAMLTGRGGDGDTNGTGDDPYEEMKYGELGSFENFVDLRGFGGDEPDSWDAGGGGEVDTALLLLIK